MPGLNGTGPTGRGAGTGRGFGICRSEKPRSSGFYGRAPAAAPAGYRRRARLLSSRRRVIGGFQKQGEW